jgi:hypothetical protein
MATNLPNNSLSDSYSRFSGPTVTLSSIGSGPNTKSKKQSALERYEAEKAVRAKEFEEMYGSGGSYERKALSERDVAERLDPSLALTRGVKDRYTKFANQRLQELEKQEAQNRANYNRSARGGTDADYRKWSNYQEVQRGTPIGQFLLMQRAAQLGGNVNSAEYRGVQQQLRNAQLASQPNNLY